MKKMFILPLLFSSLLTFNSCSLQEIACVSDVAVTSLRNVSGVVISGNPLTIFCVIKNLIDGVDECTDSGDGVVRIDRGYSPDYKENFNDYQDITTETVTLESLAAGAETINESMKMETDKGPGWYVMRVRTEVDSDNNPNNNSDAIAVPVY